MDDSSFVRSEDIMDEIMKGRKRYSSAKKLAGHSVGKMPEKPGGSTKGLVGNLLSNPDGLTSNDRFFLSRCDETRYLEGINSIADTFESNGEVAFGRMKEIIMPDSICLLDEPEISLSPVYQRELARMIELFAGKLRTQFIIATHSPFFLSLKDATIYDLDSHPAKVSRWQDLPNMHAYFQLFEQNREQFIEHNNGKDKQ
jgi:AAA15 family ATPase/GTPase